MTQAPGGGPGDGMVKVGSHPFNNVHSDSEAGRKASLPAIVPVISM